MSLHRAYVGVGTNLGDRGLNLRRAIMALLELGVVRRRSTLYHTRPWGNEMQPWFLNAVVLLETELSPHMLLERLHAIERAIGRVRGERWGPRVIDLDLLLYDEVQIDDSVLRLPHPQLRERAFVLVPLAEIDHRFEAARDALPPSELAGVVRVERESALEMSAEESLAGERVHELARFLAGSDATRVRVARGHDAVEIALAPRAGPPLRSSGRTPAEHSPGRIETIKAGLVGIFHVSRPAPTQGELVAGDRELGYIEALGIRTPVHAMTGGRLVSIAVADGAPVEYGQPLFLIARSA